MTRYSVSPHPNPRYSTWYVTEPAPIAGLSPHIIAICTNKTDAERVADALSAQDKQREEDRRP